MISRIYLSSVHMNTLSKLHEIAKKHNCIINLEVRTSQYDEIEDVVDRLCDYGKISEKVRDFIIENTEIQERCNLVVTQFILTLRDQRTNKDIHNYHTYSEIQGFISFDSIDSDLYYGDYELEEFFDSAENGDTWYEYNFSDNNYGGWQGLNTESGDYHTYRNEMHIKFFGDLVCDYLGEEKIKEVY